MPSVRDEFSKVVGVRIPENGYRKYVKELSRTGAFAGLQHENAIIILLEAVDALQKQVTALQASPITTVPEVPSVAEPVICPECGKEFKSSLGLMGHSKTHARPVLPTQTKSDTQELVQSK